MKKLFIISLSIILLSCNDRKSEKESIASAEEYYKKAKSDTTGSSFYYFNLAKNFYSEAKDSVGVARALVNMAILQEQKGDYYGGIETSLEAARYLEKKQDSISLRTSASNFNNMAICSSYLYEFDNCIRYYEKAIQYTTIEEDKYMYQNNLGAALITLGEYKKAIKQIELALPTTDSLKYAMIINNLARAKHYDNQSYNPLPEFYKALEIRKKNNNTTGENSSYATLANFFLLNDKEKALFYAKQMLNTAKKNNSLEDQIQALQKIINLEPNDYLAYFRDFQVLNDSVQLGRSKAKNQFATIRYDVEKKNGENQKLKADNSEKENKILLLFIALVLAIIIIIWIRKRKKRLEQEKELLKQEKELEVKNTQLKMSKKVHDVVANGLYHMMIDVQNHPEVDKTKILNEIEKMYEESRDISHENIFEKDFSTRFSNMIASYSSPEQKVLIVGYKEEVWDNISYHIQLELYYIIRELLINMKKHSQAQLVLLRFEKNNNHLRIKYTDNGKGINNLSTKKGAGIHNMENRIDTIKGDIIFEENPKGGLIAQITIPLNSKYV